MGEIAVEQTVEPHEGPSPETLVEGLTEELLARYEEVTLLHELSGAFGSVFDEPGLAAIALERTLFAIGAERGFVAFRHLGSESLTVAAGSEGTPAVGSELPLDEGISGQVVRSGRSLIVHADREAPGPTVSGGPRLGEAVLSVPLCASGDCDDDGEASLGVLTLVGAPDGRFTAGDAKLATTIADQLSQAVRTSRLVGSLREAEGLRRELEIAAGIQEGMLPSSPPRSEGVHLAGSCVPAANVGGDYYDFLLDAAGRLHVLVADVSGHSVSSALMMAMARNLLRRDMAAGLAPAEVLSATNASMFADLAGAGHFITMFCVRYDPAERRLEFANGGHNPPLLRRASGSEVSELPAEGAALGIFEHYPYEHHTLTLEPGDALVLFTDGVVEAASPSGEPFGDRRLHELVRRSDHEAPEEMNARIYDEVRLHGAGEPQADDVTIVTLRAAGRP